MGAVPICPKIGVANPMANHGENPVMFFKSVMDQKLVSTPDSSINSRMIVVSWEVGCPKKVL